MNTSSIKAVATNVTQVVSKNSPVILTGLGTVGVLTTVIFAVRATPKAIGLLDDAASDKFSETVQSDESYYSWIGSHHPEFEVTPYFDVLEPTEILKATWKVYLPVAILGGLSIACFIGSARVSTVRNAALASAYSLADKTLRDYQEKVVDIIGDKKNEKIRDAISDERAHEIDVPDDRSLIVPSGNGKILCCDSLTKQFFMSDMETIRTAMNDFNQNLLTAYTMDLNDWYMALGIPSVEIGEILGWNADALLDIHFGSGIAKNGEPCIMLDYYTVPSPFFRDNV
jgi:hypothetical protein